KVNLKPESRTLSRRRKKKRSGLQPRRKSRKKLHSIAQCNDGEKENDERLRPSAASSPVVFSTPFRKFVTVRRKAAAAGETMEPLRRGVPPLLSPDSLGDIEADGLTLRKRRRLCTDVSNVLSSTPQTLQKAPLLSSTPSVTLTAMPRKGNAFVRQLALSEALEDSVVLCGADPPCDVSERASPQRLRMTSPEETCPVTSRDGAGSGVKQLVIKTLSSVCLLSPVMVSSPESQSVVFIRDGALGSGLQEGGASAELFSKDFTVDNEETTPAPHHNLETPAPHHNLETRPRPCTFTPSKWKDFRRKPFQPFVPLNPRIVAEYVVQKSKGPLHELRAPLPGVSAPVVPSMQPLVRLDPAAVSNYYLKKELEKPQTLPRSTADPITPQGRTSVLKDPEQDDVDPQTMATGRKVCISGFSAKRWGTLRKKPPSTKAQQQLSFQDRSREDRCGGDLHSASLLFSSSLLTSSFLNSTAALNLNLSTDSLTTRDPQKEHQRWARLRAALSLHRRKKGPKLGNLVLSCGNGSSQ
ncbi:uncharacterized protein RB166_021594, partial [Leptodactylus fuscus]|uniref:uncharacterized protein LOC142188987 n=1 Tax=Leptodactylus fuscus TaxID=238119 RepID=UPI003F4EB545